MAEVNKPRVAVEIIRGKVYRVTSDQPIDFVAVETDINRMWRRPVVVSYSKILRFFNETIDDLTKMFEQQDRQEELKSRASQQINDRIVR